MKRIIYNISVLMVLFMVFCTASYGNVCTDATPVGRLCMEILDDAGTTVDMPPPNVHDTYLRYVNVDFGSFGYGKAVMKRLFVSNTSAANGNLLGSTSSGLLWAWQNSTPLQFVGTSSFRTAVGMGGVVINSNGQIPIDLVYAPLPEDPQTEGSTIKIEHYPFQPVDTVQANFYPLQYVVPNTGLGKRFTVDVTGSGGELPEITVTPTELPALGDDEYLLVYMEKQQVGNFDNPLVPLHAEEPAGNKNLPDSDRQEPSIGRPKWGFYNVPGTDNIVVRLRNSRQNIIKYWFLFKDSSPVKLKAYSTKSSAPTTSDLVFVYANADGTRGEERKTVTVSTQTNVNIPPQTPANPQVLYSGDTPVTLKWDGGDVNDDSVKYTLQFGTRADSLGTVAILQDTTSWNISGQVIQPSVTYYWRVTADDGNGGVTPGALWQFKASGTTPPTPGTAGFSKDTLYVKQRNEKYTLDLTLSQTPSETVEIDLAALSDSIKLSSQVLIFGAGESTAAFSIEVLDDLTSDVTLNATGRENTPYYNDGQPYTMVLKPQPTGHVVFESESMPLNPGVTNTAKLNLDFPAADFSKNHVEISFNTGSDKIQVRPSTLILTGHTQSVSITATEGVSYPVTVIAVSADDDYENGTFTIHEDQRVRMPLQTDLLYHTIQPSLYKDEPVMPSNTDPIAQPLSVGNPDTGVLKVSCKFPVYVEPVDIYVGFVYGGDTYFFSDEEGMITASIPSSLTDMKPWISASQSQVEAVLFDSIPMSMLQQGEWKFITLVTPAGNNALQEVDGTEYSVIVQ